MNDYDEDNKISLLQGGQLKMLRNFLAAKNKEMLCNIGVIYHLFSIYWPQELAQEIKKEQRPAELQVPLEDSQLIEQNKPLRFFSGEEFDWAGIKNTILLLEKVRASVKRKTRMSFWKNLFGKNTNTQ